MREFVYCIIIITSGLLVTSIALGNIKERTQCIYIGLCTTLAIWTSSLMFGYLCIIWGWLSWSDHLIKLAYGSGFFLFVIMYLFLQSFRFSTTKALPIHTYIITAVGTIMATIAASTTWVHQSQVIIGQTYSMDLFGPGYVTYTIFLIGFIFLNATNAIQNKRAFPLLTWGALSFLSIIFVTNILLPILVLSGNLTIVSEEAHLTDAIRNIIQYSPAYALLFVIPSFHAIFTKHLFHISLKWMGWLRKSTIIVGYLSCGMIVWHLLSYTSLTPLLQNLTSFISAYTMHQILNTYIPAFISPQLQAFIAQIHHLKSAIMYAPSLEKAQYEVDQYFVKTLNCINAHIHIKTTNNTLPLPQDNQIDLLVVIQNHTIGRLLITHNPNEPMWHADQCETVAILHDALAIAIINHLEYTDQIPNPLMSMFEDQLKHVGHEIRNPLATAIMQAEYLKESNRLSPSISNAVEHVIYSLKQATTLSHRLFNGNTSQELNDINLDTLLGNIVKAYTPHCIKRSISLEYNYPKQTICIQGQAHKLTQVFDNLLSNAIDFTPTPGLIHITLTEDKQVLIEDSGPGISLSQQNEIFTEGYSTRLDQSHHHGLGLSICREIIENHTGTLTVGKSEHLGGAKFCIQF
jgi:signal transduction histidine kinase